MNGQRHVARIVGLAMPLLMGAAAVAGVVESIAMRQLSASLEFSDNAAMERRWNSSDARRPAAPDLRTAVAVFAEQVRTRRADDPFLVRLALWLHSEAGKDGRLYAKWPSGEYVDQWRRLPQDGKPPEVVPVFDWVLADVAPDGHAPAWLIRAAHVAGLEADTPAAAAQAVAELRDAPELLGDFAVEYVFRHPGSADALTAGLASIALPRDVAESVFERWRELAVIRLVGVSTVVGDSELGRQREATRREVLAYPFWTGSQKRTVMALNRGFRYKSISAVDGLLGLADKAAASGNNDLALATVRAALLWYCTENDPSFSTLDQVEGRFRPVFPEEPARRRMAEDYGLLYMHSAVFHSGYRPSFVRACTYFLAAGTDPVAKTALAACCEDLAELRNGNWRVDDGDLQDASWRGILAFAAWLKGPGQEIP